MQKRGASKEDLEVLMSQLIKYKSGAAPFNVPIIPDTFKLKEWWSTMVESAPQLCELATFLASVAPAAAWTERLFSMLGWMQSKPRNRLAVPTLKKMATIKMFHDSEARMGR